MQEMPLFAEKGSNSQHHQVQKYISPGFGCVPMKLGSSRDPIKY